MTNADITCENHPQRYIRLTFSDQDPTDLKLGSYLFWSLGHTPLSEPTMTIEEKDWKEEIIRLNVKISEILNV